jgi:ABC-type amino acid transport substrate-binding protein
MPWVLIFTFLSVGLSSVLVIGGPAETHREPDHSRFAESKNVGRIRRQARLRVGVSFDEPQLSWRPGPGSELQGFEIDVAKALTQAIFGCERNRVSSYLEFVELKSAMRSEFLLENEVDLVVSNFADTPERRENIAFAGHYLSTRFAPLLSQASPAVQEVEDLNGLRVAVVAGTTGEDLLRGSAANAVATPLDTVSDCLEALAAGRVDACWTTTVGNISYLNSSTESFVQGNLRLGGEHWAVGVQREASDMSACVNEAVAGLLQSGALLGLLRRWLPELT